MVFIMRVGIVGLWVSDIHLVYSYCVKDVGSVREGKKREKNKTYRGS